MKKTRIIGITVVILAVTGSIAMALNTYLSSPITSIEVEFKKDKLIEVAFLSVDPSKQKQLQDEYFKKVMPIAKEYGMKPLAKMGVKYAYSEFVNPQMIGFFEWESKEKHQAFLKDPRFLAIKPIRDDALTFLRLGYFQVDKDTRTTFASGKLMEVYAMWLHAESAHRMQTYFKNVTPLITGENNRYAVEFPLALKSVNYGSDTYQPQMFGVAIWKSKESNTRFFESKAYKKIKADKEAAIDRLDVWQGEILIGQ